MKPTDRIVIVGAGVFGLSTALELARNGFKNIVVVDRHVPPVPDGSSVDISRVIRFDYGDVVYTKIAKEAYDLWASDSYQGIFNASAFALVANKEYGRSYIDKCTACLDDLSLQWERLPHAKATKEMFPTLSGSLVQPELYGYCNRNAGWADAQKAIAKFRDECIERGVSFVSGSQGTVTGFRKDLSSGKIIAAKTVSGHDLLGDLFILAAGAWSSKLISMHNSTIATGQVLAYIRLTPTELEALRELPIYINFDSGWFCFPPHDESGYLKIAVHGWGYTRSDKDAFSSPPVPARSSRANFAPNDGVERLRQGLQEVLPELADRIFDRVAVCWYTDTPTGDFILDYHPEYSNLFLANGGSGHAFKFLPVLGRYSVEALRRSLTPDLAHKWRFRTEFRDMDDVFKGDGSRGGPMRREFTLQEKAQL